MIAIVDYGMGNLGSMQNMFRRLGVSASIESDPENLLRSDKLVLPGVGAFDAAMHRIAEVPGLRDVLDHKALVEQVPVLGVCLGMQILTCSSEEGQLEGLCWIPARTMRFSKDADVKVPHMGWNVARPVVESSLTSNLMIDPRFYFVHSYYVKVDDPSFALMRTYYGVEFDSAIGHDNLFGVQFHPEKSHRFGMQILENFSRL